MEVWFSDLCPGPNTVYHTFFVWVAVAPSLWHPNWILHPTPSSTPPWRLRWKLIGHCISSIFAPPKLMRLNTCLTVSMWAARIKYPCAKARKVYAYRGQSVQKGPFFRLRKKYRETITNMKSVHLPEAKRKGHGRALPTIIYYKETTTFNKNNHDSSSDNSN